MPLLELIDLKKAFVTPEGDSQTIIDIPQFSLDLKEQAALRGSSGTGKTTLLHLIAGILKPDSGSIRIDGREMAALSEPELQRVGIQLQNVASGLSALAQDARAALDRRGSAPAFSSAKWYLRGREYTSHNFRARRNA